MSAASGQTGDNGMTMDQDVLEAGTVLVGGQVTVDAMLHRDTASITYLAMDGSNQYVTVQEFFPKDLSHRDGRKLVPNSGSAADTLKRLQKKFVDTAEKLSRINHPCLPTIIAQFSENDTAYVVLSRPVGDSLAHVLLEQRNRLRMREISSMLGSALYALRVIHAEGVLHGNISADSILVDENNNLQFAYFNFLLPDAAAADQISAAQVDDAYVAPEYVAATGLGGVRSDLYSLGAAFYHAIMRKAPPSALVRVTALLGGEADPITPLRKVAIAYRPAFRQGIDRALCISEADRPTSADDWMALIKADGPYEPRPGEEFDDADVAAPVAIPVAEMPMVQPQPVVAEAIVPADEPAPASMPVDQAPTRPVAAVVEKPNSPEARPKGDTARLIETEVVAEKPKSKVGLIVGAGAVAVAVAAFALFSGDSDAPETVAEQPVATEVAAVEPAVTEKLAGQSDEPTVVATAETPVAPVVEPVETAEAVAEPVEPEPTVEVAPEPVAVAEPEVVAVEPAPVAPTVEVAAVAPEAVEPAVVAEPEVTVSAEPDVAPETPVVADPEPAAAVEAAVAEAVAEPAEKVKPAPIEPSITDVSSVMSAFSVVLPFTASADAPDTIGALQAGAESWASVGRKIVSVNGIDVAQIIDINPALRKSGDLAETKMMDVDLELVDVVSGDVETVTTALPVVRDIALLNGFRFQERLVDGEVETFVTMTPTQDNIDSPDALQIGDRIVGYLATNEKIGADIDLASLMTREVGKGTAQFSFAVSRGGQDVVTAFEYTPNGN